MQNNSRKKQSAFRLRWALLLALIVASAAVFFWRGPVVCGLFYPECSPFIAVKEMPGWKVSTNSHERKMYDLAHSLRTPDSVAKPVPSSSPSIDEQELISVIKDAISTYGHRGAFRQAREVVVKFNPVNSNFT